MASRHRILITWAHKVAVLLVAAGWNTVKISALVVPPGSIRTFNVMSSPFVGLSPPNGSLRRHFSSTRPLMKRGTRRRVKIQHQQWYGSVASFASQMTTATTTTPGDKDSNNSKGLYPSVGDIVRYYDLIGGKADGEVLVGKISFIQKDWRPEGGWLLELTELEDVGDGYYAEYPSRQRITKKTLRDYAAVSPIAASYVGREAAYYVPVLKETGRPRVRAETYDLEGYTGPVTALNPEVVAQDEMNYQLLKDKILKYAALAGLAGTIVTDSFQGPEAAVVYGTGVLGSLLYLRLLSLKTDTVASQTSRMGSGLSSLRFAAPLLVLISIALFNLSEGDNNPVLASLADTPSLFNWVTKEQFISAMLGFLTYRLPLFWIQIQDGVRGLDDGKSDVGKGDWSMPGSAGIALSAMRQSSSTTSTSVLPETNQDLVTILLVSGPQATGRSELVKRFLDTDESVIAGRIVLPNTVDRLQDPAQFERLERRNEFLTIDSTGRYGTTVKGILSAASPTDKENSKKAVVLVDASAELAKELTLMPGIRIIGVWVGLSKMSDFEARIDQEIKEGKIIITENETAESVFRVKTKEIIQEIEFGISSGIFEFTILNTNEEESLNELRAASLYCFD